MKEKDFIDMDEERETWQWIERIIYFEAKRYVSLEIARKISRNAVDGFLANGVKYWQMKKERKE